MSLVVTRVYHRLFIHKLTSQLALVPGDVTGRFQFPYQYNPVFDN